MRRLYVPLLQVSVENPYLLVPGEILIILVEALAILKISRLRFFQGSQPSRFRLSTALGYSLTVNFLSFVVSVPFVS